MTVIDDRLLYANRERFPAADEVWWRQGADAQGNEYHAFLLYCADHRRHAYDEPCLRVICIVSENSHDGSKRRIKACSAFPREEKIARK